MRKIVLDVENTTTLLNDKKDRDYSPYNKNNKLVSIGWMVMVDDILSEVNFVFLTHKELGASAYDDKFRGMLLNKFKNDLASCDIAVGHNIKHDLHWLKEVGFNIDHIHVNDTMIMEYVMARGRTNLGLSLRDCCVRYKTTNKGDDLFDKYPDLTIDEMPIAEVEDYARTDIQATAELYLAQQIRLSRADYDGLKKTVHMMHEFCKVLLEMERPGIQIDMNALAEVKHKFMQEVFELKTDLAPMVKKVMGDTPVNLDSPQQLSEVIYSRRIKADCKEDWITTFNIGKDDRNKNLKRPKMNYGEYSTHVNNMTQVVLKTVANQCQECMGQGKVLRTKKDGSFRAKPNKCKPCKATGAIYTELNEIAGFKMKPKNIYFTTIEGFTTSKTFLMELEEDARDNGKKEAAEFLKKIIRLSAITSYLSNFVGGIETYVQKDTFILHPNFNQTIVATGRLSSSKPNLQNQPREKTFPIRKVFKSRWAGGSIADVDFKQLEFRCAGHLSRDPNILRDVLAGIDVHAQTRDIITAAGQVEDRQSSKAHTFKPLYGGKSGTKAEQAYYKSFLEELYPRTGAWHKELQEEAIAKLVIELPTGRQYLFADARRLWHGGCTNATQIVNYPVQGFATADIVPIAVIRMHHEFIKHNLRSLLVLTVHDSIVVDVYPGEEKQVITLLRQTAKFAEEELKKRYGIIMFIPLDVDVKQGYNLMDTKEAA